MSHRTSRLRMNAGKNHIRPEKPQRPHLALVWRSTRLAKHNSTPTEQLFPFAIAPIDVPKHWKLVPRDTKVPKIFYHLHKPAVTPSDLALPEGSHDSILTALSLLEYTNGLLKSTTFLHFFFRGLKLDNATYIRHNTGTPELTYMLKTTRQINTTRCTWNENSDHNRSGFSAGCNFYTLGH